MDHLLAKFLVGPPDAHTSEDILLVAMCHQSPAKLLRSIKRITHFLEKMNCPDTNIPIMKCPSSLSLYHLPPIDIPPLPPKFLSCNTLPPTSISPAKNLANFVVTSFPPIDIPPTIKEIRKLNFVRSSATSISPRPVYHPAIINASVLFKTPKSTNS